MPVAAFSERVGTALINGSWFLRVLKPYASRVVVMHGHRHKDWIGACGRLKIVSAPSPVMAKDASPTHFYIHALAAGPDGSLRLLDAAAGRGAGESRSIDVWPEAWGPWRGLRIRAPQYLNSAAVTIKFAV